ncbi:MAG: RNA 2',3'-cyclic phosphodiesterase [Bacteroidota bacterium]|jgi:2'-5' RNA ligase
MLSLRLFIAIEIPADIRSQIADVEKELKSANADVRWEQSDKLHITLKFLGDTEEAKLLQVVSSLEEIALMTQRFTIKYSTLGCFPHKREPRIIWIGVEDLDSTLQPLAESVESSMASLGFEKEQKKFHAHATIGRVKSQRNVRDLLRRMESLTFESQPTTISEIVLLKSELKQRGSVYTRIKSFTLHAY